MRGGADLKEKKTTPVTLVLILLAVLASGMLGAGILCVINQVSFGWYLLPIILCIDLFVFSAIGFFKTEGKLEVLYIVCSIASMVCGMIQIGIIF